jgi:hypothetical protein
MICNTCNTKLVTFKYVGYYDSFYGYKCGCSVLPKQGDSVFVKGAYGSEDEWREDTDCEQYECNG